MKIGGLIKRKMKKLLLFSAVLTSLFLSESRAQQNVQFTQYMYNTLAVNPAYAGSRGVLNASLLGRFQWVGIDGAPTTQTFYVHTPLPKEHMGVGFSVTNDKIGPINNTYISGSYSYTIRLNEAGSKLSFGASAGGNLLSLSSSKLKTPEGIGETDPLMMNNVSTFKPNFGVGAYYHNDKIYTGISTPKILENKILKNSLTSASKETRHYYWIFGGIFKLNDHWKIKPTTMVKLTKNSPVSIDITANFLYADQLWLGISHRIGDSFSGLVGYRMNDQLQIGYAYDQTITKLANKNNNGTHEVYLSYDFSFNKVKMKSPRYF
jgi:type IX secretion system PorP/SprF family membrane protein